MGLTRKRLNDPRYHRGLLDTPLSPQQWSLVTDNEGLLWDAYHWILRRCLTVSDLDRDRLIFLLETKMVRVAQGYDATKGWRFSTYATTSLRRVFVEFLAELRRDPLAYAEPIDYVHEDSDGDNPAQQQVEAADFVREAKASMSEKQQRVLTLYYLDGWTYRQIAEEEGFSRGRVRQVVQEVAAVLQDHRRRLVGVGHGRG